MASLLRKLYERYLEDEDCPTFIKEVSKHYSTSTIQKLARSEKVNTRRAAILAIGFLGDFRSNATLGKLLTDPHPVVRSMAEQAIQQNWFRVGSDEEQRELLYIERLNLNSEFERTLQRASKLIACNPEIAEAWNQRAIAHFNLLRYADSIRDCFQTLGRNPFHFPAAIGMGNCYLEIDDTFNAIESFKRALSMNPGLTFLRSQINYLKKSLDNQRG